MTNNTKVYTPETIKDRLEYLRGEIKAERISYDEIVELGSLREYIAPDDVLLLQWAGVPEFDDEPNYIGSRCSRLAGTFYNYLKWRDKDDNYHELKIICAEPEELEWQVEELIASGAEMIEQPRETVFL